LPTHCSPTAPRTPICAHSRCVVNTLRVAVIGIVLATVLGTLIGIARLSSNWLLSRLAAVYVEMLRNLSAAAAAFVLVRADAGLPAARAHGCRSTAYFFQTAA